MKQIHVKLNDELHQKLPTHCKLNHLSIQDFVESQLFSSLYKSQTPQNAPFWFIDLFVGINGIRLSFEELGGQCVFSSGIDKFAKTTYQAFYGDVPHGDITRIAPFEIPDFGLLLAEFPCQSFSQTGLKKGFTNTRGIMFFHIEEIVRQKHPKAFLLENVKGLKGHDKGRAFQTIYDSLTALGCAVNAKVMTVKDFNLPQDRERIYIVGFRSAEDAARFEFPHPLPKTVKVGDILESFPDAKYTISDRLWRGHLRRKAGHKQKGNGFGHGLFNVQFEYTNTISARYYKDGSEILTEQENTSPRKLTPLEAAGLQGFPDEIILKARKRGISDVQLCKQFGNLVVVNAIRSIAQKIVPLL